MKNICKPFQPVLRLNVPNPHPKGVKSMKATSLKISVMATAIIFLLAGASWSDNEKTRYQRRVGKNQVHPDQNSKDGFRNWSHDGRGSYEHSRRHDQKHYTRHSASHRVERYAGRYLHKYHSALHYQDHYRRMVIQKYYRKYRPSNHLFSYRASVFDPGFSITIKTKNRW